MMFCSARTEHGSHPGEEIAIPLSGQVRVEIAGGSFQLAEYALVHFVADQDHHVINDSREPAIILVIRFYQMQNRSTRRRWPAFPPDPNPHVNSSAMPVVRKPAGPATLIDLLREQHPDGPLSNVLLAERARRAGVERLDARAIGRLHEPQAKQTISRDELTNIARIYDIEPFILHY